MMLDTVKGIFEMNKLSPFHFIGELTEAQRKREVFQVK